MSSGAYVMDRSTVLQKAYNLTCIFFANKEIARRTDPEDPTEPLRRLEAMFFEGEASRLLIEVAVAVRVIDDQMKRLPTESPARIEHERRMTAVKDYSYGMFDDLGLDLRRTCNKIIHSDVMEPHTTAGYEPHSLDLAYLCEDNQPRSIDWQHLNGDVRLAGTDRGREWYVLLDLEVFIQAVVEVIGPPTAEPAA